MELTSEESLYQTVLNAPIGICILNAETLVAELVNDKFAAVAGKPYNTIFNQFYWKTFAEAKDTYEGELNKVITSGKPFYADEVELTLIRHGKAEQVYVTFVYNPVKDKSGKVLKVAVWVLENTQQVITKQLLNDSRIILQKERDRLNTFFMQAPAGICILNGPDLVYELVNPAYQQLFPGREFLNRPVLEALPELVGTPIEQILYGVYNTGETVEINEVLIPIAEHEGGRNIERYFTFSYQARHDENNLIDGVIAFVFEVTGLVKSKAELITARDESDRQRRVYEAITSGTPDLMYVFDLNYKFTYVNKALLTMWGKTWENAVGKGLRENGYEEWHAQMHEREIDKIRLTKKPIRGEVSFPHAELGKRIYDYIFSPVINESGEVEAITGTTRDITDIRIAEEKLAESATELQAINEELATANEEQAASNEELVSTNEELSEVNEQLQKARQKIEEREIYLRLAVEASNLGTWFINSVTREFVTDTRLKELFGYYPDEPLSIEQALAQITDDYRPHVAAKLENAIYNNGDYDVSYSVIGLHDQRLRWLRAIGNLKMDPSGAYSAFTGVVMDITEQKTDELRKNDFIGMVSHELKTPLTSLTAILQVLLGKFRKSDDPFVPGALERANAQVKKMSTMVNGFLNISRLESGKISIDKQPFIIGDLIKEAIDENHINTATHIIELTSCDKVVVNADLSKISAVVNNLLSNAIKYSPKDSTIYVSCKQLSDEVIISVKDEGLGIRQEDLKYIFDRYYRVKDKNTLHISGFGIGLYLSAEIIKHHNGKIWAESESGKGSTFFFSLPVN